MMKLSVILEAIDRVTAPVKRISGAVAGLGKQIGFERLTAAARATGGAFLDTLKQTTIFAAKVTAAAGVAQAAFMAMTIGAADAVGSIKDTAERIGITTQSYQRLGYAAKLSGSDQAELGQGLTLLNRQIDAAARGNKAARNEFRRMGIDLRDQNGKVKDTEQVFRELADRISRMPDGAAKSATAMRFFGRSGANLVPMLNQGSAGLASLAAEAERFGIVLSTETVEAIDSFGDGMDRWRTVTQGLQFAIVGGLMPVLNPLLIRATEWLALNRAIIAENLSAFFAGLPRYIEIVIGAFKVLFAALAPVVKAIGVLSDLIGPTNTALVLLSATIGTKMVLSVIRLTSTLWPLGKAFVAVAASLGKLAFASIASMLGTFTLALQAGTGVMAAFNAVLLANPIGAVVLAVVALAGAAYLIYRNWGGVSGWFKSLGAALISIAQGIGEVFAGIFTLDMDRIVGGLKTLWGGWVEWFRTLLDPVLAILDGLWSAGGGAVAAVARFFGDEAGNGGAPPPPAASVPVAARSEVGGEVRIRVDAEGRPRVERARSDNPSVPLAVDTGMVMP